MDARHWEVLCPRSAILIEINTRKTAWKSPKDSESDQNYSTNWRHRSARAKHWSHDHAGWLARLCMSVSLHFVTGDIANPTFRSYNRWDWGMYAPLAKKKFAQVRRRDIWFAAPLKFFATVRFEPRNGCDVTEINFNYPLHGSLHDQFRELSGLQQLHLDDTNVEGDVAVLKENTKLEWLFLSSTRISGNLKNLQNVSSLRHLDLSKTEVSGDIGELTNAELRYLHLSGSKISGALVHWKEIQDLQLSGTKVQVLGASFMEDFWPRDAEGDWICPFPSLKSFDVSGTPLSTTVEKLLRPFLGCRALQDIKAAECNLTGAIPSRLEVDSQGSFRDHTQWPLSQALRVFDLASNNVTRVEALPPKCQAVILAGNPSIEFKTGVLEKAVSNKVALDLQNVWFVNKSDTKLSVLVASCVVSAFLVKQV